jgi:integrase
VPAAENARSSGRLTPVAVNRAWNQVAAKAGVDGKTPHSARHAMGRHVIQKTGNVAAVQRQLGHKNAVYAMQYMRVTEEELDDVVNDRSGSG